MTLLEHFSSGTKVDQHGPVVRGDKDVGRFDVQMQHFVLVDHAQATQHFFKQRTDGRLTKHFGLLEVACNDDEFLQAGPLKIVHHHVNGVVFLKKIKHAHHCRMGNLGQ
ncbi:hypothetical protein GALL_500640 [mine drainage metagenome]|uniref:Uncharacterized protein n=1 Tax=mine drainage metagenome TaxID=410659 RepID=A0A1J5PAV5_9ZZZZ